MARTHRSPLALLPLAILPCAFPARAAIIESYIGPNNGLWSSPANWSLGLVPNNSPSQTFDVLLDSLAGKTLLLDASVTINNLTISALDTLSIQDSQSLTLAGASLSNAGKILLNQTSSLLFSTSTQLTGHGSVQLYSPTSLISGSPSVTLTTDNAILGQGSLTGIKFINNGTISGQYLQFIYPPQDLPLVITPAAGDNAFINNGSVRAYDLGGLKLSPASYTNNGIISGDSEFPALIAGTITGGTLSGTAMGAIATQSPAVLRDVTIVGQVRGVTITLSGVTRPAGDYWFTLAANLIVNQGTLLVLPSDSPQVLDIEAQQLVNSGLLALSSSNWVILDVDVLSGGGTVFLSSPVVRISSSTGSGFSNDNYLEGHAGIAAKSILNSGIINATGSMVLGDASLANSFTNTGMLRAHGGTLVIGANPITTLNNTGGILESDYSGLLLLNADLSGGTLRASAGGQITFATNSHTAVVTTLDLSTGAPGRFTATLDLASSKLIIQSTTSAEKQVKVPVLFSALQSGSSVGTGIISSTALAGTNHYGVAFFDNADLNLSIFANQAVDQNSLFLTIAILGDANSSGSVDITDQSIVTNHWQTAQFTWSAGDLNSDGFVDLQDLTLVTNNWQQSSAFSQLPIINDQLPAPTPEPFSLALLLPTLPLLLRRRTA